MTANEIPDCDVLVIGSGIAGVMAGLTAAETGARTTIASLGPLFSGSSFFPGTWGLGLIGPESPADEDDLIQSIQEVGCGMANPLLVETLVRGIVPAIARLGALGAELKRPDHAGEREFIPCFDRKQRLWRGIVREPFERALGAALAHTNVTVLPQHELIDLVECEGRVAGALLCDSKSGGVSRMSCGAVVLACGGYGGLFERKLTGVDVTGTAHAIALRHGARLVNLEFMQMMPGLVHPCRGVVFNEKAFRFMEFEDSHAARALTERPDVAQLLDERSGYGPFTSRLESRAVDAAMDAAGAKGLELRYRIDALANMPEFVRTYYDWLGDSFGVQPEDWIRIAPYAHAANGGILINEHAETDVPGLFACGECTGGMHGADRIGGLSSANGLVFGMVAGKTAAQWAQRATAGPTPQSQSAGVSYGLDENAIDRLRTRLQQTMSQHCMIARTEEGLATALAELGRIERELACAQTAARTAAPSPATVSALRLGNQLTTAQCVVTAMQTRKESRGAHYRADFPTQNPAFAHPSAISWDPKTNRPRCDFIADA